MVTQQPIPADLLGTAMDDHPTLRLLRAYSSDWVLPLFAECLEPVPDSVSAEWFHERVGEALDLVRDRQDWQGERTPSEHCRKWVDNRWLETEMVDGRTRYRLSSHSLAALRVVRELIAGDSSVSEARLGSIAHAMRRLADLTSPDRDAHLRRLDEEIEQLRQRREAIAAGEARVASDEQLQEHLGEVLSMTRSMPADFRQLRAMVEDRHKKVAQRALAAPPKAELVEEYLREHDLLAQTREGMAYRGFARMLSSSPSAEAIRRDIDQVLASPFGQHVMTPAQRQSLESMVATLLHAQLQVEQSRLRWTASLRRIITRAAHGRHAALREATEQALAAAAAWVEQQPTARSVDADVLRVGRLGIEDVSQTQLWRGHRPGTVTVTAAASTPELPASERAALRLVAGTGRRAVARTINQLLADRRAVTGSEVYEQTPAAFQRLGTLVSLIDLAVSHGRVDTDLQERVAIAGDRERELRALLPRLLFDRPITLRGEAA